MLQKLLAKLANHFSVYLVTGRWVQYTSKATGEQRETLLYSNSSPQKKAILNGKVDKNVSVSVYDLNNPEASKAGSNIGADGIIVSLWFNGINREEGKLYEDAYGKESICILRDGDHVLLTLDEAQELSDSLIHFDSDASDVSTEQHASVE